MTTYVYFHVSNRYHLESQYSRDKSTNQCYVDYQYVYIELSISVKLEPSVDGTTMIPDLCT